MTEHSSITSRRYKDKLLNTKNIVTEIKKKKKKPLGEINGRFVDTKLNKILEFIAIEIIKVFPPSKKNL